MKTHFKQLGLALALCGACAPAFATNWLEGRFAGGKYELDDDIDKVEAEEATGFDLRAQFEASPNLFFSENRNSPISCSLTIVIPPSPLNPP